MPATEPTDFFRERRSASEIKKEILGQYFEKWCNIRVPSQKEEANEAVLFIDMQAGNGYAPEEGPTQPAVTNEYLYKSILKKPRVNESVRPFFYDTSKATLERESATLEALSYYQELMHPPVLLSNAENKALMVDLLEAGSPSLICMDPFSSGYAKEMLLHAIQAWDSDLFMLLSPKNITKALTGKKVSQHLMGLLGDRIQKIGSYCRKEKDQHKQQEFILGHFISSLQEKKHVTLLFKVNLPDTEQPYHYLLFSSPDVKAYRNFKEMMLPYTAFQKDGVALFVANDFQQHQFSLFEQRPVYTIPNLVARLTEQYALYKYKSIDKIYEMDSCDTPYTRENYLAAFEQLRKEEKIELLNGKTMQTIRQPTPASVVKYRL